ncbi:isoamyl acetate-hydrolyzing esterase 1 homolog [Paramacrobiotus metropolitanus]|uniref:isoamyl acetate-hydrolyzing esterase 1 homolog n=1 Tax=Paramacrobiotus metropolitanus TaxID=2943436 RepID=UPI002445C2F1|nr:isoamyl acetate-hydrolyzing esterase 1 homolog [Paramacrobiotus metropolitanus]
MPRGKGINPELALAVHRARASLTYAATGQIFGKGEAWVRSTCKRYDSQTGLPHNPKKRGRKQNTTAKQDAEIVNLVKSHPTESWREITARLGVETGIFLSKNAIRTRLERGTPEMEQSSSKSSTAWPQVVLFGDSHFQNGFANNGIASLIAAKLQRRCDVLTRGFNGYNTRLGRCALDLFLPDIPSEKIAAFVILFGSNDCCLTGNQVHLGMGDFVDNLTYFVQTLTNHGVPANRIILMSPPPTDQEAWTRECHAVGRPVSTRDNGIIEKYSMSTGIVASGEGAHFADLFATMLASPNWKSFLSDGLHLNANGAREMFGLLEPLLDTILQSCPMRFPDWKEVNLDSPEADFRQIAS